METKSQIIYERQLEKLGYIFLKHKVHSVLFVCGKSFLQTDIYLAIRKELQKNHIESVLFQEYEPNPQYESVVKGVGIFRNMGCDMVIGAGGGSSLDVAKCIKLFSNMELSGAKEGETYLTHEIVPNTIPLLAIPTTAGSGSEATHFSVLYYKGEKQSVAHASSIPNYVLFAPSTLASLPAYHRRSTMMDALCHAIESFWSVKSTEESRGRSKTALNMIVANMEEYLENKPLGNEKMLLAAHRAGTAIDVAQTTAAHAMSYKLTAYHHIAHGHAAALCLPKVWNYMRSHLDKCADKRGKEYLSEIFSQIAQAMGCSNADSAIEKFERLNNRLGLKVPALDNTSELEILSRSVNVQRLKNNPVELGHLDIYYIYKEIFGK